MQKKEGKGLNQPLEHSLAIWRGTRLYQMYSCSSSKWSETAEEQRPSNEATRVERKPIWHGSRTMTRLGASSRYRFLSRSLVKLERKGSCPSILQHFLASSSSSNVPRSKPSQAEMKLNLLGSTDGLKRLKVPNSPQAKETRLFDKKT